VLEFDVGWSSYLTAGTATATVKEKKPSYNAVAYYIVAEGRQTSIPTPVSAAIVETVREIEAGARTQSPQNLELVLRRAAS